MHTVWLSMAGGGGGGGGLKTAGGTRGGAGFWASLLESTSSSCSSGSEWESSTGEEAMSEGKATVSLDSNDGKRSSTS